jgi:hypothetical protein
MFFRSQHNKLHPDENQLLQDLGILSGFKATSDLPQWMNKSDLGNLKFFLEETPFIQKRNRYCYRIGDRNVDFSSAIPLPASNKNVPVWLARNLGLLKIVWHQAVPAIRASLKK